MEQLNLVNLLNREQEEKKLIDVLNKFEENISNQPPWNCRILQRYADFPTTRTAFPARAETLVVHGLPF